MPIKLLVSILLTIGVLAAQPAHSVVLNWAWTQGSGGAATGYQVQRGTTAGGPYATVGTVPDPAIKTFTDSTGLTEGTRYCYVVEAVGGGGVSAPSPEACGTVPFSAPNAPTSLTLTVR